MKDDLSQKIHGNFIISVYMCKYYKYDITLLPKKQKWSSPEKKKNSGITEKDDIYPRKYNVSVEIPYWLPF